MVQTWEKDTSSEQIKYFLRDTFANRRLEMKSFVGRPMFKLCMNYPMMKEDEHVSYIHIRFGKLFGDAVLQTAINFSEF